MTDQNNTQQEVNEFFNSSSGREAYDKEIERIKAIRRQYVPVIKKAIVKRQREDRREQ